MINSAKENWKYSTDRDGTSLQGHITVSYSDLVEAFGNPNIGPSDKTRAEWSLKFEDGTIATIYDWKTRNIPLGLYAWHIGGHNKSAVERVIQAVWSKKRVKLAVLSIL